MTAKRARAKDGGEPPLRVLTDPRAIRALAHPARLAVLDALEDGTTLTATECAELAGLTPSAMSYHLRALEKWGFVRRADATGDGRERPWSSTGIGWRVEALADTATAAATTAVTKVSLDRVVAELQAWFTHKRTQPKEWQALGGLANQQRWLTPDEARRLQEVYEDFLDTTAGRTAADHPDGARRVRLTRIMVPVHLE